MGSAVSSAASATKKAIRDTTQAVQVGYRQGVNSGLREEINRATAVAQPTNYAGNAVGVATVDARGDVQAGVNQVAGDLGITGQPVVVGDSTAIAAPEVVDPQQKRKRQLAGRAGTLLTGGMDGGGTNLGGAGDRSTLLGL